MRTNQIGAYVSLLHTRVNTGKHTNNHNTCRHTLLLLLWCSQVGFEQKNEETQKGISDDDDDGSGTIVHDEFLKMITYRRGAAGRYQGGAAGREHHRVLRDASK